MKLLLGDCIDVMKTLEENSVDTVITDPPYGLEFMGKEWDKLGATVQEFDESIVDGKIDYHGKGNAPFGGGGNRVRYGANVSGIQEFHYRWAHEAIRVAKPGAMMLCFGGTRTFHRIACGIEDAGWEIRDTMMWVYGSGFPKSYNIGKNLDGWDGWGTALKPAWEPIIVAMKPRDGTFVDNALKWGVAGLNIDGGRVPTKSVSVPQPQFNSPTGGEMSDNSKGRWPANVIHDGSEEVVSEFPNSGNSNKGWTPGNEEKSEADSQIYGWAKYPDMHKSGAHFGDSGSAARFFYCAKASKAERNAGMEGMPIIEEDKFVGGFGGSGFAGRTMGDDGQWKNTDIKNRRPAQNNHPTVKPLALMEYLCRLTATPTGGVVLDPFMGSGTTGMACAKEGRDFIGIEMDEHYFEIAEKRIAEASKQPGLFNAV